MRRLIYSPKVNVWVRIFDGRVIDISEFVVRGSVTRKINEVSTAEIELRNPRKMWSQPQPQARKNIDPHLTWPFFHPMDGITIYLTRKPNTPVQVFTGYLDTVPYIDLAPHTVNLKASCTLKKLMYTQWDASLPYSVDFLTQLGWNVDVDGGIMQSAIGEQGQSLSLSTDPKEGAPSSDAPANTPPGGLKPPPPSTDKLNDGAFGTLLFYSLQYIAGWDPNAIYVDKLPGKLVDKAASLFQTISKSSQAAYDEYKNFIIKIIGPNAAGGGNAVVGGAAQCQQLANYWTNNGGDPSKAALFASIAMCESSGNPNAGPNSATATGLWQIQMSSHPEWASKNLKDPNINAQAAIALSSNGKNTAPWVSSQGCWGSKPACTGVAAGVPAPALPPPDPGTPGPGGSTPGAPPAPNPNDPNATGPNDCQKMGQGGCGNCTVEICAYGTYLKGKGFNVTEAPCFGGVCAGCSCHVPGSQHCHGNAMDIPMNANDPGQSARGDALVQEALGFGFRTIWKGKIEPGNVPGEEGTHFDHVHIDNANCTAHFNGAGSGGAGTGGDDPEAYTRAAAFAQVLNFPGVLDQATANLVASQGEKALMATSPLLPFIQEVAYGAMRSFMSMPDGKFYAFYPDYFGSFGDDDNDQTGYWEVDDLEILDGKITLSDEPLATHVFVIGDLLFNSSQPGQTFPALGDYAQTTGVVSIMSAIMSDFLNLKPTDIDPRASAPDPAPAALGQDPKQEAPDLFNKNLALRFLDRYGARPFTQTQPQIRSPFMELIVAMRTFMLMWSRQFATDFQFTYMPELYPGGIVRFPSHGFQCFVEEVKHNFDFTSGFTTDARLIAPSTIPGNPAELDAMTIGMIRGAALDQTGTHPPTPADKQAVEDHTAGAGPTATNDPGTPNPADLAQNAQDLLQNLPPLTPP